MKKQRRFPRQCALLFGFLVVAGCLLASKPAMAQSSGPYVDECSSGDDFPVEYTGCIYGTISELTAYQESDLESQGYSDWVIGQVSDAQIYDGNTLVADAGNNCNNVPTGQDCSGDGGESSYASTSVNSVNAGDNYTFEGPVWEWYDPSNEGDPGDAYWTGAGEDSASVQVTGSCISFSQTGSGAPVTMSSSTYPNAKIFYTVDGSYATEASIEYNSAITLPSGATVNAVAVQWTSGSSPQGIAIQSGQANASDWKTIVAATQSQAASYGFTSYYDTPGIDEGYCGSQFCDDGTQGVPSAIDFLGSGSLSFPSAYPTGSSTAANLAFTTEDIQCTYPATGGSPPACNAQNASLGVSNVR